MSHRKDHRSTYDAAVTLLGRPLAARLDHIFRCIEIAEEEIAAAKASFPEHSDRLHLSFRALQPSQPLCHLGPEKLYRAHCKELLGRIRSGGDLRPGTNAELLAVLSAVSLEVALDRMATLLYVTTFKAVFPSEADRLEAESPQPPPDD